MASQEQVVLPAVTPFKYSKRVLLKTVLGRDDGGLGLVGERMVIGGWVKSSTSKEVKKEPSLPPPDVGAGAISSPKDVSCVEILRSQLSFFKSIMKVLGGGNQSFKEKLDSVVPIPKPPPPPSIAVLQVSDGSCVASLQVLVESSIASPRQVMPVGTCILAEGIIKQPAVQGKHVIEFQAEKIMHVGVVDHDKYPLTKKKLPLEMLRDLSHFRPRTTTVASVMRIRSALMFATQTFFQNHGCLYVQVPIITTTDCEGFSDKFQVTTLFDKVVKKDGLSTYHDAEGVSLDVVKAAIKEKSNLVEELKRSESNREALAAALQDLQKTNVLASQLESREKLKSETSLKVDEVNLSEEFFSRKSYLTVSGCLHLESYACALGNVYSFGPRFGAVKSDSSKCVAEMWMVELEMAFSELEDVINCAEDYLKFLSKWVLESCYEDMNFVTKRIDKNNIYRLQSVISTSFTKISYSEAVEMLKKVSDKVFKVEIEWGVALTEEHVSYLVDEIYKRPLIVCNYPKEVKPFYIRLNDDKKTVAAFDMVVPKAGILITGGQNEERLNMLDERIKELGLPKEQYEWYLDLRRHGTVKTSGFSFGLDLMVLLATGLTNVRDVIPFPRSLGKVNN